MENFVKQAALTAVANGLKPPVVLLSTTTSKSADAQKKADALLKSRNYLIKPESKK